MSRTEVHLDLTDDWYFQRNLIAGRWSFPCVPYEFDVRSPATSEILATVGLSSQRDVASARDAARGARHTWGDTSDRVAVLERFAVLCATHATQLTAIQSWETGLQPTDSGILVEGALNQLAALVETAGHRPSAGVTGIVLASGAPALEFVTTVVAPLALGDAVVVKPSLRAPLTVTAMARLLEAAGAPSGVVNIVQGAGADVGAAMISDPEFDRLCLRGRATWTRRAAAQRLRLLRPAPWTFNGAANAVIVGPGYDAGELAAAIRLGLRPNSAGGPLQLATLMVHIDVRDDVRDIAIDAVADLACAPLSSSSRRNRTLTAIAELVQAGGEVLTEPTPPDDRRHRMGWYLPPVVLAVPAGTIRTTGHLGGPILLLHTWETIDEVRSLVGPDSAVGLVASTGGDGAEFESHTCAPGDINRLISEGSVPSSWTLTSECTAEATKESTCASCS